MREDEIRPQELGGQYQRLHAQDTIEMLRQKDEFVDTRCPACNTLLHRESFEKGGFHFVTCKCCDTLYIRPRPTEAMLAHFYQTSKSIEQFCAEICRQTEDVRREKIHAPRAAFMSDLGFRYGMGWGPLVDVGAGYGTFCEEVQKLGMFPDVIAIEPAAGFAQVCREKGLTVIQSPIEHVSGISASVITAFETVEHLFSPAAFLETCKSILLPGGILVLTMPNIRGFDLDMLGPLSDNIDGPNHLNYFHPDSIRILLSRSGYDVLELTTPGELDAEIVRKYALDGRLDLSHSPFLKKMLVDNWDRFGARFQSFLSDNNLSSHMRVVARRR